MSRRSHGDGRRMTLAEAVERRTRMLRFNGGVGHRFSHPEQDRRWAMDSCRADVDPEVPFPVICYRPATAAEDVGLLDGVPVAMCARCRGASS